MSIPSRIKYEALELLLLGNSSRSIARISPFDSCQTNEKLGFEGQEQGIATQAIALITRR